jgi:hypothetical protein
MPWDDLAVDLWEEDDGFEGSCSSIGGGSVAAAALASKVLSRGSVTVVVIRAALFSLSVAGRLKIGSAVIEGFVDNERDLEIVDSK